jgi:hypothetical protein
MRDSAAHLPDAPAKEPSLARPACFVLMEPSLARHGIGARWFAEPVAQLFALGPLPPIMFFPGMDRGGPALRFWLVIAHACSGAALFSADHADQKQPVGQVRLKGDQRSALRSARQRRVTIASF